MVTITRHNIHGPMNTLSLRILITLVFIFPVTLMIACESEQTETAESPEELTGPSLLVFSKTEGFRHDSIEHGIQAVQALGQEHGVQVEATEDASVFNAEELEQYDAVLFLNTTGTLFNADQREAFQSYINSGGGYAGVHSAADTEYEWPWYGELAGGWFESHPPVQQATVLKVDPDHISTYMLPDEWEKVDEWYNYLELPDHVEVLLELDTDSFEGSGHPGYHPIAWYHDFDGGRAFYTGLGHSIDSWSDNLFLDHLWGGLQYAMNIRPQETGGVR